MKKLVILLTLCLAAGLLFMNQNFMLTIFSKVLIFSIAALGLNLLSGYTGQISLGHGAFMAIGAYVTAIFTMKFQLPFAFNLLASVVLAGLLGLLIGIPALRLKGFYLAIATMAFGVAVEQLISAMDVFGGHTGIYNIPRLFDSRFGMYLFNLGMFGVMYAMMLPIINSPFGMRFKMVRDSESAANAFGVNLTRVKLQAFVISAVYGGVAGALYAHTIRYISPPDFGLGISINLLSMIIIGGMATFEGGFIGAIIIAGIPFLFSRSSVPMSLIIGPLLIIFVLFFPHGIAYGLASLGRNIQYPYIRFRVFLERRRKRSGSYAEVFGHKMFYAEKGEGPAVVYLHGNLGSGIWFDQLMDIPGYRTIAPDMVNFGLSSQIDDSEISSYAKYLGGFLDVLKIDSCFLVAHSLGGAVAQQFSYEHKDRVKGMVLVDSSSVYGLKTPEESYPIIALYRKNRAILKKALKVIMPEVNDEKFIERAVDYANMMNPASFEGHARTLSGFNASHSANGFNRPVLFLVGKKDILITEQMARETVDLLPQAEVMLLDGVGHSIIVEDSELFLRILRNYLETYG
jgi:branched-chain amino acid transport system permease protein